MSETAAPESGQSFDHGTAAERITIEPAGKSLRALFNGEIVAQSANALVMHEQGYPPRVYFPPEDLRAGLLAPSDHTTHCPFKGDAAYWTLRVGGATLESAAWAYPDPLPGVAAIKGHVSFVDAVTVED